MKQIIFIACFLLSGFFIMPSNTVAQPIENEGESIKMTEDIINENNNKEDDFVEFYDLRYYSSHFSNMAKLAWRYDFPDLEDDQHLDYYLAITECSLYKKYKNNEFEWIPIRKTIKDYIEKNKDNFPRRFYFDTAIILGDYNKNTQSFMVAMEEYQRGLKYFLPGRNEAGWLDDYCDIRVWNYGYDVFPNSYMFKFLKPFVLQRVFVEEDKARKLIEAWARRGIGPKRRVFYIRMFFTLEEFLEFKKVSPSEHSAVFLTQVNGYQIFSDMDMEEPVLAKSFALE